VSLLCNTKQDSAFSMRNTSWGASKKSENERIVIYNLMKQRIPE